MRTATFSPRTTSLRITFSCASLSIVIAAKIAAHIADIVKGINGARERDKKMSQCRKEFDWQGQVDLSIDPKKTIELLEKSKSANEEGCTMCGEFCAIKLGRE